MTISISEHKKLTPAQARQYSPLGLAFFGDSVYELLVREKLILSANMQAAKLHRASVRLVCASFQAEAAMRLESALSEEESDILRRGRNCTGNNVPKSSSPAQYHLATGLEALFGYLYLIGDSERIYELFEMIMEGKDETNKK